MADQTLIPALPQPIGQLVQLYNLQNLVILSPPPSPYAAIAGNPSPDKALYNGVLNTPVYANISFKGGSYTDVNGNIYNFPTITFDTVILTVSQHKNIVTTEIQGRPGTVKEYIGLGDYQIGIKLIITGANGTYPRDQVSALRQMLIAPLSIEVTSWYLQMLGISYLTISSFDIDQAVGGYSYQAVSISAFSDSPVEFSIS